MLALYLTYIDDENDKNLFRYIYFSYRKQMLLMAAAILQNDSDAEDVVHDVFTNIAIRHMNVIRTIQGDAKMRNYLLKATKNTALNWKKKSSRIVLEEDEEKLDYNVQNINNDAFVDYICMKMECQQIADAIEMLEKKYQDVLYYHFILGMPISQVAKLLNQTIETTKKQLNRGKKKILYLLNAEGENEYGND